MEGVENDRLSGQIIEREPYKTHPRSSCLWSSWTILRNKFRFILQKDNSGAVEKEER